MANVPGKFDEYLRASKFLLKCMHAIVCYNQRSRRKLTQITIMSTNCLLNLLST